MNVEIKAAITEATIKRDKGIEMRQKQLAAAISGLAILVDSELASKAKDSMRAKQLMDVCRILCDIQYSESVVRRNFAIHAVKKDLKEPLVNSKIDNSLFGENLSDTIKSAKAVSKTGNELKTKQNPPTPKPSSNIHLNWKSPAPARKQQQPYQQQPYPARGRAAAPPPMTPAPGPSATRSGRNTRPASSSRPPRYPPRHTHQY